MSLGSVWGQAGDWAFMLVRVFSIMLAFALAGCGRMDRGPFSSPKPSGSLRLPASVNVDDGRAGGMALQVASLVEGSGGVNAGFGSRGYSMGGNGSPRHDGIDILAPNGAAIRA